MKVKGIVDENLINYKAPSMEIITSTCSFKCDKECGQQVCQNSALASAETVNIDSKRIIKRYLGNPITRAICFAGLEPFDQFEEMRDIIRILRGTYLCNDTVVIYTGYNKGEIADEITKLQQYKNIIVKFGRFVPNSQERYDDVLGVTLASDNQYAEVIS